MLARFCFRSFCLPLSALSDSLAAGPPPPPAAPDQKHQLYHTRSQSTVVGGFSNWHAVCLTHLWKFDLWWMATSAARPNTELEQRTSNPYSNQYCDVVHQQSSPHIEDGRRGRPHGLVGVHACDANHHRGIATTDFCVGGSDPHEDRQRRARSLRIANGLAGAGPHRPA